MVPLLSDLAAERNQSAPDGQPNRRATPGELSGGPFCLPIQPAATLRLRASREPFSLRPMKMYRFLLGFDVLAFLVLLFFFATGLGTATNDDYVTVWLPLLLVPAALIAGGIMLHSKGKTGLAKAMLAVLAVPPFVYLLFVLMFIILQPDMK